jgi:two-component system cell cycle sensor histidine kinase/response regulator CckA
LTFLEKELSRPPNADEETKTELRMRQVLAEARQGAERVRDIVRSLKTFARPELEARGPVDVLAALEASIAMVSHEIRCRAVLHKKVHPGLPSVFGNSAALGQVFLNLLLNAVQALPDDDPAGNEIVVVLGHEEGRVLVEVRDTGAGIAPDVVGRIFEPFFTTKPVGRGTGLGLAICHGIVTAHGGTISVDSQLGKGSCFRVRLPVMGGVPRASSSFSALPSERPARLLVVDDEPNIGTCVRQLLEPVHHVDLVTDAQEALARIRSGNRYDVVLCDLMMPSIDGPRLYDAILGCAPEQARRMVFVTGGVYTERAERFLASVSNPHLEKPFTVEQLMRIVREVRRSSRED